MTPPLSRRTLLAASAAGSASLLATGLATNPARASVPAAGKQMPGAYRFKVGDFEVTAVTDGVNMRKLDAGFVRNAPLDRVQGALADAFLPTDVFPIGLTALVVNTGRRVFLIDTGMGDMGASSTGQLVENLSAAGIDANAIDAVIISHFHGDHINGLRAKAGDITFPNAEISVPAAEWAFWMDDAQMSRAPDGLKGNFQAVRRVFGPIAKEVMKFEADEEIAPGIQAIAAYGHTPGHTIFRIASGSDQMLFTADTSNVPALFVRNPGWHAVFDMNPTEAEATRRKVFDMAVAEKLLVQGYHFPFPGSGHLAKDGEGYKYVPVNWKPVL